MKGQGRQRKTHKDPEMGKRNRETVHGWDEMEKERQWGQENDSSVTESWLR